MHITIQCTIPLMVRKAQWTSPALGEDFLQRSTQLVKILPILVRDSYLGTPSLLRTFHYINIAYLGNASQMFIRYTTLKGDRYQITLVACQINYREIWTFTTWWVFGLLSTKGKINRIGYLKRPTQQRLAHLPNFYRYTLGHLLFASSFGMEVALHNPHSLKWKYI